MLSPGPGNGISSACAPAVPMAAPMTATVVFFIGETPFPEGSLVRERPGGAGGMGLHMPNRPYAAPGIPKGRVAPVHGPETRIGTGGPRAVA